MYMDLYIQRTYQQTGIVVVAKKIRLGGHARTWGGIIIDPFLVV